MVYFILASEKAIYARNLVLSIASVIIAIVLCFFLIKSIIKQEKKLNEANDVLVDTMMTKTQMRQSVNTYATKVGSFGSFAMFYISVDDFDSLKELIGGDGANNIIRGIAERLVHMLKGAANIAKFSDNTFVIFDKKEYNYDELQEMADNLLDLVNDNGSFSRRENVQITASIGVAMYPTCGVTFKELFSNLELASYIANRQGGNKYIIYYNELKEEESGNLQYFNEVREAMQKGELTLFYQPIIDVKQNQVFGFEALLRWDHPKLGIIPPAKFISVLEQSGDITYLAKWSLEQVIKMQQEIERIYPNREIKLSINLSVKQMMDDGMSDDFKKIIHKYNAKPNKIILEIAQYAMFEKMNAVRVNLLRLRDIGFEIATDGLGLDYSAVTQIETRPIDVLKLDRGFLGDITDNQMQERYVQMLVDSCAKTRRIIISEGVENKAMLEYIKKNGIDYAQGYYYSKPFPGKDVVEYIHLESWKKDATSNTARPKEPQYRVTRPGAEEEYVQEQALDNKEEEKNEVDVDNTNTSASNQENNIV
ncbi:MAG: GGDEF domain-containing phosphodiesterase [Acholeplasmatales bacterium]|nr:GGDEF domain-containing phosphodiesterase [Acholeplasmatales bacterium]